MIQKPFGLTYQLGPNTITRQFTVAAEGEIYLPLAIPNASDTHFDFVVEAAGIKWVVLDAPVAMTFETNAADHSGGELITLAAGVPLIWWEGCGQACPIQIDVDGIWISQSSGGASTLGITVGYSTHV